MNHDYLDAVTAPLADPNLLCAEDNEQFAYLEDEMLKLGSLRERDLDWRRAEQVAVELLRDVCKHMRVLAHLSLCLQQSRDGERFVLSVRVLNAFLAAHWTNSQPWCEPASRALTIKRKILQQILRRTVQYAGRLDLTEGDQALLPDLEAQVEVLQEHADDVELEFDQFWRIGNDFNKALPVRPPVSATSVVASPSVPAVPAPLAQGSPPTGREPGHVEFAIPDMQFDASNEREVKQALFKVARLLGTLAPQDPLSFRIRRYALWFNISSMPMEKKDGTTELMAVSPDRVTEYREGLKVNPDNALLQAIEHSVSASPFWLTGSYLSSVTAKTMDCESISDAIRDETHNLTRRLPGLLKARFSDGTPFADEETRHWLQSGASGTTQGAADVWTEKLNEARQIAKQGQYEKALFLLEKGCGDAQQPRDLFYWRLMTAEFFSETGLKAIAQEEYRSLLNGTDNITVRDWEPELIVMLRQKSGKTQETDFMDIRDSQQGS